MMKKILIANRGEIAVRVIRACHDLGLHTVAVYSKADEEALHVLNADEAVCIGEAPAAKSYLNMANILAACEITGADAIHPGYGFLSENANFASICQSCGIEFIGPSAVSIALLGDKAQAKMTAKKAGCPIIPGSVGVVSSHKEALALAEKIGYPVFIKASAGGGGRGIRIATTPEEFPRLFAAARTEAEVSFGNPEVYLEKMISGPRHIEVQVLGDKHGNYVHLRERDCTVQRRRQKLIEEATSPCLERELAEKIGRAAVAVVKSAGYYSAGTVEFLLDQDHNFYFMEVNTRIQVEHTVTEELTGVDLVKEQLLIAMEEKLAFVQEDIECRGHVIQFRINAENPLQNFAPSPGKIEYFTGPGGPNVRLDTACYAGYVIPPFYDSMIAKLIVKGKDRQEAIAVARRALREFHVGGIHTTIPFHLYMLENPKFLDADFDIHYIDKLVAEGTKVALEPSST